MKVIRWKAMGPLVVFAAAGAGGWILFADRIARKVAEDAGTAVVGAKVEIRRLHIDLAQSSVTVRGLTVASPFAPLENLLEADELVADLDVLPLLEKKIVIDRVAATGLRFGTPRRADGRTGGRSDGGVPARVMGEVKQWSQRFKVPALQLATGEIDVAQLNPSDLGTVRAAEALAARLDSSRQAWNTALQGLDVAATLDTVKAVVERLRGAKPTDLRLLNDARQSLAEVKRQRERFGTLERSVTVGIASLRARLLELNEAKQRDYGFARGLLKLPSFDAPQIGAALFAPAAIERFERALYWAQVARAYMPPGLLPRAEAGPKRARRAGTTVRFPRERAYPGFLLRSGEISFELGSAAAGGAGGGPRVYAARLTGLTSEPALYGRPSSVEASAPAIRLSAVLDHVRGTPKDSAAATVQGIRLPAFALPGLPIGLDPGRGTVQLAFVLQGDSLRARWGVRADAVRWARDTAAPAARSELHDLVWRVLSGIGALDVTAELTGTIGRPRLAVRSNLDRALAERLRAVAGEELAAAERKVRAEVDRIVEEQAAPVRAQVAALSGDLTGRLGAERARLDQAQQALEQRLRELTRGLRLP